MRSRQGRLRGRSRARSMSATVRVFLPVALLVSAGVSSLPIVARAAVPNPDQDPFYSVPSRLAGIRDGTVLASRQVQAMAGLVPMPARAWQVKYKTIDNLGRATATITTVMVPSAPWTGVGPRPLVSYQVAEDGVALKCAASYALRAGVQAGDTNTEGETQLMLTALQRGWAVAAPDYEGPNSQFTGVKMSAHGVIDGLRAALAFRPAGIARHAPLALWGYSGGALASAWAAQLQPVLAPHVRLSGVALGGVVGDLKTTFLAFNGGPAGGALPMALSGVDRSYPRKHILRYLNAAGRQTVAASSHDCIADGAMRYPFWSASKYEARPDVIDDMTLDRFLKSISPATMSSDPSGPIYMYTSQTDELAPIGPALALAARYCSAGVTVDQVTAPLSEHIAELALGAPGALQHIADRFARVPPPDTCAPGSHGAARATAH
jgi:pimeloyl-ACP methyl ester carboxylesterase